MKETIFEVLISLFENCMEDNSADFPADEEIRTELFHAGFAQTEVNQAFNWLESLNIETTMNTSSNTFRIFSPSEQRKLDIECRNFLLFLEYNRILSPSQRELVIERAMGFEAQEISLDAMKWIALMVLLSQNDDEDKSQDFSEIEGGVYGYKSAYLH
jgi:Smg protein